jgi:hypothetical protein
MEGRGPRGIPRGNGALTPIAWGTVQWDAGVPYWLQAGGEFGAVAPVAAGPGPVGTSLVLSRSHDMSRIYVDVSSHGVGYACRSLSVAAEYGVAILTPDAATPFTVVVFEEQ